MSSASTSPRRTAPSCSASTRRPRSRPATHRPGAADLFAALDVTAGTVIAEPHRRHRARDFRHFLTTIDAATPADLALHLILDNSAIHKTAAVQRWLLRHPRVPLHFTPTSASWLNLVESWFALLQRRELARAM